MATKHNLKAMSESIIHMREQGIKSVSDLDKLIQESATNLQTQQDKIKVIEKDIDKLSATMELLHTLAKYREHYKYHKANPTNKSFSDQYSSEISLYKDTQNELKKSYYKLPKSKDILARLDKLQEKKNTLMQEYSTSKSTMNELFQIRKNYETYVGKEMER